MGVFWACDEKGGRNAFSLMENSNHKKPAKFKSHQKLNTTIFMEKYVMKNGESHFVFKLFMVGV